MNDLQTNRKSVRIFEDAEVDEKMKKKIESIVSFWDGQEGPFGNSPRLTIKWEKGIAGKSFKNESGIIVGSYYPKSDPKENNQISVDLGYKIYCLSLYLEKENITSCVSTNFNELKVIEIASTVHTMEFNVPLVLVFGTEKKSPNIIEKLVSWFYLDSFRYPISKIVDGALPQFKKLYEAVRHAPSSGNSQTWRLIQRGNTTHFYTTSSLEERYTNVGCALAAFCESVKANSLKGRWEIKESPSIYEYIISWNFSQK